MTSHKPAQLFRQYAVPQMVGLLFNSIYLIVDGVFIGNRLGREALAAAAVSVPAIEMLIALSMAVTSGATILISGSLGRGEEAAARRRFILSLSVTMAMGLLISAAGLVGSGRLARLLGATPEIQGQAQTYLWYILSFSPFLLFSFLMGGLVRSDGRPRLAMIAMTLGALSNVALDWLFMYPLNMGIAGAALATAIGPMISVAILLPHFLRKKGKLYFCRAPQRLKEAAQMLTLGFPAFIMEFTIGAITLCYNLAIVHQGYGQLGLAAFLLIGYLMLMLMTVFLGLAEGLQPVFAYLAGAGERTRLQQLLSYARRALLFSGLLCCLVIWLFPHSFYALFAAGDSVLIQFAAAQSRPYFSGLFLAGLNILLIVYWQATGAPSRAMLISLLRSLILPPVLLFALPFLLGREVIWLAHSLSETLTLLAVLWLMRTADARQRLTLADTP